MKMATLGATPITFSSFLLSPSCLSSTSKTTSSSFSPTLSVVTVGKSITYRGCVACSAVQEFSPTTTSAETKAATPPAEAKPSARPKPAAKAPAKPLQELMLEDVIPSLKTILEAQDALSQIELTFQDNKLEGSFLKEGCPYSFWAFFPDGVLTGPKGFSLSSYGSGASTVEPFLIDEKKITARHVVFWVEKRLAAQGIIPVWNQ